MYTVIAGNKVRAPAFPPNLEWIGVDRPLQKADLMGRITLLDFWTFCCINCMHIIPDLRDLEDAFGDKLQVIGIHSAKFTYEQGTQAIRLAMQRYGIHHPVANDHNFQVWRSYGVRAWPTLALIDPEGYVIYQAAGEGHKEILHRVIADTIDYFKGKVTWANLIPFKLESPKQGLRFPGKVAYSEALELLAVAETGANRILLCSKEGKIKKIIGSGQAGRQDGKFTEATFNQPQGLAFKGHFLYAADTKNHLIREIDLEAEKVTTVAGNGLKAYNPKGFGPATQVSLNSPWDLTVIEDKIYIAMAGNHQIWVHDIKEKTIGAFAGAGGENILDGPPDIALFAQPSGITSDGRRYLYVADAETSSVRRISLASGFVNTLIGTGLFDFGRETGSFAKTELQHPLDLAYEPETNSLFVADSYNHRILEMDLDEQVSRVVVEGLHEPGGLTIVEGNPVIADTNAGRLVVAKEGRIEALSVENEILSSDSPVGCREEER